MPPFAEPAALAYLPSAAPAKVETAESHGRDLLLLGAALERIAAARMHLDRGECAAKSRLLHSAMEHIGELRKGLDLATGNVMVTNLDDVYDYAWRQLSRAMLQNRRDALDEVADLLREIGSAWMNVRAREDSDVRWR